MSWEDSFRSWAKGPADTETVKCENAERAVLKALNADSILSEMDITVFAQGSYRNKTNVRLDSDVDICVRLNTVFYADYPTGTAKENFGNIDSPVKYTDFKNLVQSALEKYFGQDAIKRGNKAFNVHANTYRIDADVIATFEHRRYCSNADGSFYYLSGIAFKTDDGKKVYNWPVQHFENGVKKHDETGRRYRKIVRVLKHLRNKMQDDGISAANEIASCLIESLIWNVPNDHFGNDDLESDVRHCLAFLFNHTIEENACEEWGEVSELKYLFRATQPWTPDGAHNFVSAAWDYLGFQ